MIARILYFAVLIAGCSFAQTSEVADTLFMNDASGTRRVGRIVGMDASSLKVEVALAGGGGTAMVSVPRQRVNRVEFAPNDSRERLVSNPTAENSAALGVEWRRWQPFLAIARSPAGAVGNAYGAALLAAGNSGLAKRALEIFKRVERESWSKADRAAAKQGRLRAMVATGHAADAMAEASELAKSSEDPSVLIEAKFILAEAARAKLRKLVEENPRWTEDPSVRPEYARLTNEVLDLYLHPYLFFGSEAAAAARGLWGAVQVYRFVGDDWNAAETARDLATLYAGSRHAVRGLPPRGFGEGIPRCTAFRREGTKRENGK